MVLLVTARVPQLVVMAPGDAASAARDGQQVQRDVRGCGKREHLYVAAAADRYQLPGAVDGQGLGQGDRTAPPPLVRGNGAATTEVHRVARRRGADRAAQVALVADAHRVGSGVDGELLGAAAQPRAPSTISACGDPAGT